MNFDYIGTLATKLYALQARLGISGFDFFVDSEQAFLKKKDYAPNTIYVVVRALQNERSIGVDTQPMQLLIMSEEDSLETAKAFFSEFAKEENFKPIEITEGTSTIRIKQQYTDPVVLSNFNMVASGYRSVLYMSANLFIMKDVVDMKDLKIDSHTVDALSFDLSYNMTPNTQQFAETGYIAASVKSVSTMSITLVVPATQTDLLNKVLSILAEDDHETANDTDGYGGNEDFAFDFYLGSKQITKSMKLVSVAMGSAIADVPTVQLGFMK